MGQIVNRRTRPQKLLSTLADGASFTLDNVYDGLQHKAFLFEYEVEGIIGSVDFGQWSREDGINIVLVRDGVTDAELEAILAGAEITDESAHVDVPERQRLMGIADWHWDAAETVSTFESVGHFRLHFKPKSKGGIPFSEGSGWELRIINRGGALLTTGDFVTPHRIYERFAYEGGS